MYITITAGHSNTDPGAVNGSDREADIAQLSDCVVKDFAQLDYNTLCDIMNRTLT